MQVLYIALHMLVSRRSDCPISLSLELFGDRWTLLILRDLILFEKKHFKDFAKQEGIASNILTDRLKKLIAQDIIVKSKDPKNLSAFIYNLTDRGITLVPLLVEVLIWGKANTECIIPNRALMKSIEKDKSTAVRKLIARMKLAHIAED